MTEARSDIFEWMFSLPKNVKVVKHDIMITTTFFHETNGNEEITYAENFNLQLWNKIKYFEDDNKYVESENGIWAIRPTDSQSWDDDE